MSGYWIKIVAKALVIFVVGMVVITMVRKGKNTVHHALNSSDPIPIPLIGLVPFRLDNDKLGSVSRVEFLRSDPQHVSGVRVVVSLADSVQPGALGQCQIALDDLDHINDRTTFRCGAAGTPQAGLEQFGVIALKNSDDTFPLLLPADAISRLRQTSFRFHNGSFDITGPPDLAADALEARTDSLTAQLEARIEARSDSIDTLKELSSDLEDSSAEAPQARRRTLQRSADSVRTHMRALLDLMKGDEARLASVRRLSELASTNGTGRHNGNRTLSDSIQKVVAEELNKVQGELERAGVTGVKIDINMNGTTVSGRGTAASAKGAAAASGSRVSVEAPAPPKPAAVPKAPAPR